MKAGEIFYTSQYIGKIGDEVAFQIKGHIVSMVIGHVRPGFKPPSDLLIKQMECNAGLIRVEDLRTCLGQGAVNRMKEFTTKKYAETETVQEQLSKS
jgi:hypothetical protein